MGKNHTFAAKTNLLISADKRQTAKVEFLGFAGKTIVMMLHLSNTSDRQRKGLSSSILKQNTNSEKYSAILHINFLFNSFNPIPEHSCPIRIKPVFKYVYKFNLVYIFR